MPETDDNSISKYEYVYKGIRTGLYKTNRSTSIRSCEICKGKLIRVFDNFLGFVIDWCPECDSEEVINIVTVPERSSDETKRVSRYSFEWAERG